MFRRLLYYRILSSFRTGSLMFWNLIFPILLATFLSLGLSGIMHPERLDSTKIQVDNEQIAEIIESIETDGVKMYESIQTSDPVQALKDEEIIAYIPDERPLRLIALREDMEQSVLSNILDVIQNRYDTIETVMTNNPTIDPNEVIQTVLDAPSAFVNAEEDTKDLASNYFYSIIAMVCLGAISLGIVNVHETEARFSSMGKRLGIVPHSKMTFLVPFTVASLLVNIVSVALTIVYIRFVLRVPVGEQIGIIFAAVFMGTLLGLLIGMVIGFLVRGDVGTKIGVGIAFYLFSSFLAGMMSGGVKELVSRHAPIIHKINPSSLITDTFNALYYFETPAMAIGNIGIMVAECAVLFLIVWAMTRRTQYEYV